MGLAGRLIVHVMCMGRCARVWLHVVALSLRGALTPMQDVSNMLFAGSCECLQLSCNLCDPWQTPSPMFSDLQRDVFSFWLFVTRLPLCKTPPCCYGPRRRRLHALTKECCVPLRKVSRHKPRWHQTFSDIGFTCQLLVCLSGAVPQKH